MSWEPRPQTGLSGLDAGGLVGTSRALWLQGSGLKTLRASALSLDAILSPSLFFSVSLCLSLSLSPSFFISISLSNYLPIYLHTYLHISYLATYLST